MSTKSISNLDARLAQPKATGYVGVNGNVTNYAGKVLPGISAAAGGRVNLSGLIFDVDGQIGSNWGVDANMGYKFDFKNDMGLELTAGSSIQQEFGTQKGIVDKHRRSLRWGDCLKTLFISGNTVDVSQAKSWDGSLRFYSIGYVPWPRPNDTNFDDLRIAVDGVGIQFIMASGRDYSQYGEECTAENIYWALVEMYNRTKQYYEGDDIEEVSGAYLFDSDESKKAIKYIYGLMQEGKAYYEPYMSFVSTEISNENNISLFSSDNVL